MSPPPPPPPAPPIHAPKKHHHQYHMVNQEEIWCPPPTIITNTKKSSSSSSSAKTVVCISACLSILMFLLGLFLGAFVHAVVYPDGGSPISSLLVDGAGFGNDSVVEGVYVTNEVFTKGLSDEITNEKLIQSTNEKSEEDAPESTSPPESLLEDHRECMNMTWYSSRLPRWFQPIEYRIQLHPNLTTNLVKSKIVIEVVTVEKTNQLILNAEDLTIGKFEIRRTKKKNQVLEAEFTDCKLMTQWSWKFEKHLKPGEKLEIHIEYESEMKSDLQGLYLSTHFSNGTRHKSAATQFEPTFARKMLPCFDEPDFKAHFIVSIIRAAHHIARSNMPMRQSTWIEETGLYEDVFEKSVKMSTYLLAVAVLDNYAYVRRLTKNTKKPIEVRLYAPADVIQGQSEFGLDTGIRALEFFESYFDISYPLEKIDLLALDDFSEGAMENWGLVTFRDAALLFDETKASCVAKEHIALIICHEMAHQWFGNLVTMAWWNEVYLNEGFANYMEYKCVDALFPTWNIMTRFYAENVAFSHEPDGLLTTRAIEADDSDSIMNLFDAINYHKAAAIIHMIAELAGQQNFQKALIEYLNKFAYANAKGVELWKIVEKHANHLSGAIDIPTLAHAYTSQTGYPLVVFEGREDEAVIHNQTRFTFHEMKPGMERGEESWPIPISYRVEGDETVKTHWLLPNRSDDTWQIASGNDSWIIVNTGGVGYFKVQYDEKMYRRLTRQLKTNHSQIAAIDRAMLLVDTFDLTRTSRLSIDVYLNLVEYAEAEQDKMTWTIINKHLQTIESLIDDTAHLGTFRDFQRSLLLPLYESFSWHQQPTTPMRKGLQIETFHAACRLTIIDCTNQAHKLYRHQWLHKNHLKNPEFSGIVLEEGIRRDGKGAWEQIWKNYNATTSPAERNSIINSLASVKDVKLINKLLNFCLDGQIKLNLIPRVFSALSQHSTGRNAAWRFFKLNFDKFHKLMGSGSTLLATCIRCLAEPLSTQQDLDELKVFLKEKQLEEEGQMKIEQTYEQVELNIQWRRLNEEKFGEWLENWDEKRTRFND